MFDDVVVTLVRATHSYGSPTKSHSGKGNGRIRVSNQPYNVDIDADIWAIDGDIDEDFTTIFGYKS